MSTNYINYYHVFSIILHVLITMFFFCAGYHVFCILPHVLIAIFYLCAGPHPNGLHEGEPQRHGGELAEFSNAVLGVQAGWNTPFAGEVAGVLVGGRGLRAAVPGVQRDRGSGRGHLEAPPESPAAAPGGAAHTATSTHHPSAPGSNSSYSSPSMAANALAPPTLAYTATTTHLPTPANHRTRPATDHRTTPATDHRTTPATNHRTTPATNHSTNGHHSSTSPDGPTTVPCTLNWLPGEHLPHVRDGLSCWVPNPPSQDYDFLACAGHHPPRPRGPQHPAKVMKYEM